MGKGEGMGAKKTCHKMGGGGKGRACNSAPVKRVWGKLLQKIQILSFSYNL